MRDLLFLARMALDSGADVYIPRASVPLLVSFSTEAHLNCGGSSLITISTSGSNIAKQSIKMSGLKHKIEISFS